MPQPASAPDAHILIAGPFAADRVSATVADSTFSPGPDLAWLIDRAWAHAASRPGVKLFDGPLCRLESHDVVAGQLRLVFSPTSYRPFMGTNLSHAELADFAGPEVLANPVGVSCVLESADGMLLMGVRSGRVAYYPGRLHPFAGAIEWPAASNAPDIFAEARRELAEELRLSAADIANVACLGIVGDRTLRQPEVAMHVRSRLRADEILARLDPDEHDSAIAFPATREGIEAVLAKANPTPVGAASLMLWQRTRP